MSRLPASLDAPPSGRPRPTWFDAAAYDKAQAEFLPHKYGGRNIRVVVAVAPPALRFLMDHRDEIVPGAPVVHVFFLVL